MSKPLASPRRRPPRKSRYVPRPAPGSLYYRIIEHSKTSLFVRPVCFTDLHTELLRTSFREIAVDHTPIEQLLAGGLAAFTFTKARPTKMWKDLQENPVGMWSDSRSPVNPQPIHDALEAMFGAPFMSHVYHPRMHLWFDGKTYHNVMRVAGLWNFNNNIDDMDTTPAGGSFESECSDTTNINELCAGGLTTPSSSPTATLPDQPEMPMLAHISRKQLRHFRKFPFRLSTAPGNRPNIPVQSLSILRSKQLHPANPDEDAYLIPAFLSMAQRYFYVTRAVRDSPPLAPAPMPSRPTPRAPMPDFHDIELRLLVDHCHPNEYIVYTATVTAAFLRQFHCPFRAFVDSSSKPVGMEITYAKVPLEPAGTFRERLGLALGPEIVGTLVAVPQPKDAPAGARAGDGLADGPMDSPAETPTNPSGDTPTDALADVSADTDTPAATTAATPADPPLGSFPARSPGPKRKRSADDDVATPTATNEALGIPGSHQQPKRQCVDTVLSLNILSRARAPSTPPSDSPGLLKPKFSDVQFKPLDLESEDLDEKPQSLPVESNLLSGESLAVASVS